MINLILINDSLFSYGINVYPTKYNLIIQQVKETFLCSLINIDDTRDVIFNDILLEELSIEGISYSDPTLLQQAFAPFRVNFNSPQEGGLTNIVCNQYTSNTITFKNVVGDYFGTAVSPLSGVLIFDSIDAVRGGTAIIYYINDTLDIPEVLCKKGEFIPNQLTKLYIECDGYNNYTVSVWSISTPNLTPSATAPTITVTTL